jgi:2-haloacid dehalogenase
MLGAIHRVPIRSADVDELKELLWTLPAYPDVPAGLRKLKDAGFRLVTLTDSPDPVSSKAGPLANAGLAELFERQFAADSVRQYKPSRATYQMVSQELNVSAASVCMVAAHVWDVIGAKSAGCLTALLARNGVAPLMLAGVPQPDVIGLDLTEVADALVRLKAP